MGVNGLWTVVQPCARPTNLATLNRKRLAVDASIWIYQFLKAVRDKEGNALRNSHVVGFFRRICKLLWFGIRPVFVFDGGAPALKRATLQGRRRTREGRQEDAARTAGKLLAVQMQRIAEGEANETRKKRTSGDGEANTAGGSGGGVDEPEEVIPDVDKLVYVDELGMSRQERQRSRRFHKQDAYHLPELDGGIESMGRPDDPRIMSIEELEEYARQFHSGEDINLYDFSKIDFDGEFFKSLPPPDRYNILNAARIRSRLRMGLSKEQLDDMFPDRMAFSRFQIERVKERNHLTQRLMYEVGMTGTDLTVGVNVRIAGDKNREYILVKNDGAEGGWALGVVSREKDKGEIQNPIDVDALQFQYQGKDEDEEWEDDDDFEDIPIEGLNRLPKLRGEAAVQAAEDALSARQAFYQSRRAGDDGEALFIEGNEEQMDDLFGDGREQELQADEDEDLSRAIALSLQNQHGVGLQANDEEQDREDMAAPEWTQKAVTAPKPITNASGRMVAHIVNNRASAAVPKRRNSNASSDSDMDLQAALAAARKKKNVAPQPLEKAPVRPNVKNPFDGPLPFEKLDWRNSIFGKKPTEKLDKAKEQETGSMEPDSEDDELEGGFVRAVKDDKKPRPLPPWLVDNTDIRESVKRQQEVDLQMNAEDQELAEEEQQTLNRQREDEIVEINSSEDGGSDVEIIEVPESSHIPARVDIPTPAQAYTKDQTIEDTERDTIAVQPEASQSQVQRDGPAPPHEEVRSRSNSMAGPPSRDESPEMEFEDVALPDGTGDVAMIDRALAQDGQAPSDIEFEDAMPSIAPQDRTEGLGPADAPAGELFADGEFDDVSDAEEEELLAQMAEEAEEHARFASTLNNKSARENQEAYERELRALRTQQKKDRRDADEVTQIMVSECQSLLRLFGIPYITAPMEAEAQCAELVRLGLVDGVVTDDSDIFLFGGTRVYKNMFNSNKFVECYLAADLEKELSLSRGQLIALAQLLGSDYTEGLPGVGPVTAVEILSEFPGDDGLARFKEWWQDVQTHGRPRDADAASPFRRKFRKSQVARLFLPPGFPSPAVADAYQRPEVDGSAEPFRWGVPSLDGLREFLTTTIGWSQERTDEVLVPVIKDMNRRDVEGTQSNITRYFEGAVGVGAKEAFAPRQKAKGSKRMADAVSRLRATTKTGVSTDGAGEEPSSGTAGSRKRRKGAARAALDDDDDDDGGDKYNDGSGEGQDDGSEDHGSSAWAKDKKKARGKKVKAPS